VGFCVCFLWGDQNPPHPPQPTKTTPTPTTPTPPHTTPPPPAPPHTPPPPTTRPPHAHTPPPKTNPPPPPPDPRRPHHTKRPGYFWDQGKKHPPSLGKRGGGCLSSSKKEKGSRPRRGDSREMATRFSLSEGGKQSELGGEEKGDGALNKGKKGMDSTRIPGKGRKVPEFRGEPAPKQKINGAREKGK